MPGQQGVGDYELLEPVVHGAVVQVWRARTGAGRDCVVKFPIEALAGHAGAARLIEREWEFLRRAAQPGVVEAMGLAAERTGPALVTEFLPGGDLVVLAGSDPRHWARAMRDLAGVVRELHGRGIVHGDLKLRNVVFDAARRATLIDFALAHAIGQPWLIGAGTAAYRRHAQPYGVRAQPAVDVHALGVMIFELFCGALPFGCDTADCAAPAQRAAALARLRTVGAALGAAGLAEQIGAVLEDEPVDAPTALAAIRDALQAIIIDEASRWTNRTLSTPGTTRSFSR